MATYASFIGDLNKFAKELGGDGMVTAVGVEAKKIAKTTAAGDLGGDPKFSGWKPTLDTRFDVVDPGVIVHKPTKRSAGPWTVAEKGRNGGRGHRGANGRTRGHGTASKATGKIEGVVSKIVDRELTKIVKKTLGS